MRIVHENEFDFRTLEDEDIKLLLPNRRGRKNKGSFGKVLIIAGSSEIFGAAFLSAICAYRIGAGLVKICTDRANENAIKTLIPEALFSFYLDEDFKDDAYLMDSLSKSIEWADVVLCGPGIGISDNSRKMVEFLTCIRNKPIILDADALNILSKNEENAFKNLTSNFILTPHLMEMKRMVKNFSIDEIKDDMVYVLKTFNKDFSGITVLKDARTIVNFGEIFYLNQSGNSALSKGGSGDCLAGIIAGLIAQYPDILSGFKSYSEKNPNGFDIEIIQKTIEIVSLAVFIHGKTADNYVKKNSEFSMLARDIGEELKHII